METAFAGLSGRCLQFVKEIQSDAYSYRAWNALLTEISNSSVDPVTVAKIFELALEHFPAEGNFWYLYANYEYKRSNFSNLEEIFAKSLPVVINSVDLWKLYLRYVKETSKVREGEEIDVQKEKKDTIIKAFEAAIASIGSSPFSGSLWQEYIEYTRDMHVNSFYEEQQKMELLRKIFSRAILVPTSSVESIWKEYDAFENNLNKLTAKKILGEKSPQYMLSRSVYREMSLFLCEIKLDSMPSPPTSKSYNENEFNLQFNAWNRLLEWEAKNPLLIENSENLHSRIMFWYRMAVVYLKYCPQIWLAAADYLIGKNRMDEAAQFFADAAVALPNSLLVNFSYAEFEEISGQIEAAKTIFESLLERLTAQINKYIDTNGLRDQCPVEEQEQERDYENFERLLDMHPLLNQQIQFISLVFINYMRFSRRTEGIKSSRLVFSRARKTFFCISHVFIAAALMEYFCTKDSSISMKIFELGMKRFSTSSVFVVEYLKFLIMLNDDINTRSLFERAVSIQPKNKPFWQLYLDYLCEYGDLADIQSVQKRFAEAFPVGSKENAQVVASKYKFLDLSLESEVVSLKARERQSVPATFAADPLATLLKMIPQPCNFHGPAIKPEQLCEVIGQVALPKRTVFKKRRETSDDEDEQSIHEHRRRERYGGGEQRRDLFGSRQQQKRRK